jgi:anti-sigma regulatory factor (Ser/Thr protein kinase)
VDYLLQELTLFTGPGWEQEDDVTLVVMQRSETPSVPSPAPEPAAHEDEADAAREWQLLTTFEVPSEPGNERKAMEDVTAAIHDINLSQRKMEQLRTAVAEATMNAMEHGNQYEATQPVAISVLAAADALAVRITDHGGGPLPATQETPDLEAKLAGLQSPRGWGLFLIENMVDELKISSDALHHTVELVIYLEEGA